MKDQTFKVRMTQEEYDLLAFCKARTGKTKSEIVRLGIREIAEELMLTSGNGLRFAEEITRKDVHYKSVHLWEGDSLLEVLRNYVTAADARQREKLARIAYRDILSGKTVTFGSVYVSEFRIATEKDIAAAKRQETTSEEELNRCTRSAAESFSKNTERPLEK